MMKIVFFIFPILFLVYSCKAQHDFEYLGELPEEKYVIYTAEGGAFIQTSGDSIEMRNRVYVQLDSFGQVRINGHQYPFKEIEQGLRYVLLNPENKDHLPKNFQSAVVYANFLSRSTYDFRAEQLFRTQYILQTINHIAFSEMGNYVSNILKKDWMDINEEDVTAMEEKYTVHFAQPVFVEPGIQVKLPDWSEEEQDITKLKARNVMTILVNAENNVLIRAEPTQIKDIKPLVKEFISNPNQREDLAESPKQAVISLKNDRKTSYKVYLEVYNEIKAAYNELWESKAQKRYNKAYESLNYDEKKSIRADIPLVISEAEPTNLGDD